MICEKLVNNIVKLFNAASNPLMQTATKSSVARRTATTFAPHLQNVGNIENSLSNSVTSIKTAIGQPLMIGAKIIAVSSQSQPASGSESPKSTFETNQNIIKAMLEARINPKSVQPKEPKMESVPTTIVPAEKNTFVPPLPHTTGSPPPPPPMPTGALPVIRGPLTSANDVMSDKTEGNIAKTKTAPKVKTESETKLQQELIKALAKRRANYSDLD